MPFYGIQPKLLSDDQLDEIEKHIQELDVYAKKWNYTDHHLEHFKSLLAHISALRGDQPQKTLPDQMELVT